MAKDLYHDTVKTALIKDGWLITHDPYEVKLKELNLFSTTLKIDLGAEKMIAAEKGSQKIAVEVKTLLAPSLIYELHNLVGQFLNYQVGIDMQEPDRLLYVAIPQDAYERLIPHEFFRAIVSRNNIRIITYEPITQTIISWES